MPVTLTAPGVYIQELPSGNRAITGVATAVTAFVGRARRGPTNEAVNISSWAEFEATFGPLWRESGMTYAVRDYYLNGGSAAVIVRLAHSDAVAAELDLGGTTLVAHGPGVWGNQLRATVIDPDADEKVDVAERQGVDDAELFHLEIEEVDAAGATVKSERFLNVTVVEGPRRLDRVLERASQLVRVPSADLGAGRPVAGGPKMPTVVSGVDGGPLAYDDFVGATSEADRTGMYAVEQADLFTILCLPPAAPDDTMDDRIWPAAAALCVRRRAFLVVDPPTETPSGQVRAWMAGLGLAGDLARNAGLYYPRVRIADPLRDGAIGLFAPCGAVAGTMARTDTARGVWKAPAGVDAGLVGVKGLEYDVTDAQHGPLNSSGINVLRTFRDVGSVVWGARTTRGADTLSDDYKYVPVRRLALFLEESLYRSTQWVVFEPNDDPLWAQIRASVGGFMQDLFRKGAFQGRTPRDAYLVKCDSETTTQYDIDRGIVNILVGFAPLKPAEFVVISIQQRTANPAV